MLENYITYLKFLDEKLERFFKNQQNYIFCKKGCTKCCKNAHFPYSQIEVQYLVKGFFELPDELKEQIYSAIDKTAIAKINSHDKSYKYDCPFLINNECSVYKYRGIICRSFGLLTISKKGPVKVPFCCFEGLNFSNVVDEKEKRVSGEKFKKLGFKEEPVAFNVSYEFLTDADFERAFNFSFGEKKPLIDWFIKPEEKNNEQTENNI